MQGSARAGVRGRGAFVGICFLMLAAPALVARPQDKLLKDKDQTRSWKDASGKFEVRAKLVERTSKEVKLLTDKGREVTVPIDRLSKADRDYLDGLAAPADNPFAGGRPATGKLAAAGKPAAAETPGEKPGFVAAGTKMSAKTVLPGMGTTLSLKAPAGDVPFVADPRTVAAALPATAVPLERKKGSGSKFWGPVVTSDDGGRCLVALGKGGDKGSGTICLFDLKNGECREVWQGAAARAWDHDEGTGITLVSERVDDQGQSPELSVFSGFDGGSPKRIYQRTLPGEHKYGSGPKFEWVAFAAPTLVAAIVENALYVWDLAASRLVYRVDDVDTAEPPAFSGTRKYMALSQRSRVMVLETASGKVLRAIATGGLKRAAVAFDPTGTRLGMCSGNQFLVWDLVKNESANEGTTLDDLGTHPIRWVSPDMFLSGGGGLVHVPLQMTVWNYSLGGGVKTAVLGDKLAAIVDDDDESGVAALEVPHAPVEAAIAALEKLGDEDMVMLPGKPIRVTVEAFNAADQARIAEWVARSVQRTGWEVRDDAPVTLSARLGQEPKRQLRMRNMDLGSFGSITEVTMAPFFAELTIRRGNEVLWQRQERNRLPFVLMLEEGETAQQAVDRYTKPNAAFFAELRFPPRLPDPQTARLVGRSSLGKGAWK